MLFRDRVHAGQLLAAQLSRYGNVPDPLVCALPRGGVIVGFQVAEVLHAPLDVVIVRKLGVPGDEEVAMGAIASGGIRVLCHDRIEHWGISPQAADAVIAQEERELARREAVYRGDAPAQLIQGRTVLLVDDGIATGETMRAAAAVVRRQEPRRFIIAVPVAPRSTCDELTTEADEIVCLARPHPFHAIGAFYEDFHQVSDDEVRELLRSAAARIARRDQSEAA